MADTKYLIRRGKGYAFRLAVPGPLQGRFKSARGKPLNAVVIGLGTDSLAEAQRRRWPLLAEWQGRFERATAGPEISLAEIDAFARAEYRDTLAYAATLDDKTLEVALFHSIQGDEVLEYNLDQAELAITQIERHQGIVLEQGPGRRVLAEALVRAQVAAMSGAQNARVGILSPEPETFLGAHGIDPRTLRPIGKQPGAGLRLTEACGRYLAETQRDASAKLTEHTIRQSRFVFGLLQSFAGDAPLAEIDRRKAAEFLDDVAARRGLSNRTLNRYCSALSAVWIWANKRGLVEQIRFEGL